MNRFPLFFLLMFLLAAQQPKLVSAAEKFALKEEADGITVELDGELFTRYLTKSGRRPVLWPVIGPTGEPMTRAYPVAESELEEAKDHIHHRSIWVGYEGVNELDYWHEPTPGVNRPFPIGQQRHREFVSTKCDGNQATIVAVTDWLDHEGKKVCEDQRSWTFGADEQQRWLDCRLELKATEGEVRLGDSKEGFFAVRVADSMNVDHKKGGRIVSSRGPEDAEAWGKPAEWIDYQGIVGDERVGIAILAHPESYGHPAPWHVRTYGLFACNPLGRLAFRNNAPDVKRRPLVKTIPKGESLLFHYRVILHKGNEQEAELAKQYARYKEEPVPSSPVLKPTE